jgi:hypothetical protein
VNDFLTAVRQAAAQTTAFATAEVRQRATNAGWEPDVVGGTSVQFTGTAFETAIAEPVKDRAFVAEFGNEEKLPTAVLRKYNNDSETTQELFLTRVFRNMEGLLL